MGNSTSFGTQCYLGVGKRLFTEPFCSEPSDLSRICTILCLGKEAALVGQGLPSFLMLSSRPGKKRSRWVAWLEEVRQSLTECHHLQMPRTGGIFVVGARRKYPHHSFCVCDGDPGGNARPEDIQTGRLFSLATFVPHSSPCLVYIATLRPVASGSQVADGGPRRQQTQINLRAHQFP